MSALTLSEDQSFRSFHKFDTLPATQQIELIEQKTGGLFYNEDEVKSLAFQSRVIDEEENKNLFQTFKRNYIG